MAGDKHAQDRPSRPQHAQASGFNAAERRIVQRYNRLMFAVGLTLAVVIPPLIYRWKRQSMAVAASH